MCLCVCVCAWFFKREMYLGLGLECVCVHTCMHDCRIYTYMAVRHEAGLCSCRRGRWRGRCGWSGGGGWVGWAGCGSPPWSGWRATGAGAWAAPDLPSAARQGSAIACNYSCFCLNAQKSSFCWLEFLLAVPPSDSLTFLSNSKHWGTPTSVFSRLVG